MITYNELLKTPEYWITKIQLELYTMMNKYMESNNLSRSDLAKKLGVTKGYISQVLNGDFDHRLSKLVELSMSVGMVPQINFIPVDKVFVKETKVELSINNVQSNFLLSEELKKFNNITRSSFSKIEEETVYKKEISLSKAA